MQSVQDDFPASSYAAYQWDHLQFVKHPTLYCICMYILHSVSLYIYIAFAMSSFLQMAAYPNNGRAGIVAHPGSEFCLSLTLCGQLGSSNQSSLFILSYQQPVTYTFIIDPSVFTYDSALSFLVIIMCALLHRIMWCPSTYIRVGCTHIIWIWIWTYITIVFYDIVWYYASNSWHTDIECMVTGCSCMAIECVSLACMTLCIIANCAVKHIRVSLT